VFSYFQRFVFASDSRYRLPSACGHVELTSLNPHEAVQQRDGAMAADRITNAVANFSFNYPRRFGAIAKDGSHTSEEGIQTRCLLQRISFYRCTHKAFCDPARRQGASTAWRSKALQLLLASYRCIPIGSVGQASHRHRVPCDRRRFLGRRLPACRIRQTGSTFLQQALTLLSRRVQEHQRPDSQVRAAFQRRSWPPTIVSEVRSATVCGSAQRRAKYPVTAPTLPR
jgi:hypothetical protein